MNKKNLLLSILSIVILLSAATASANASGATPTFPSCINPQGQVRAWYDYGSHGVPGDTTYYEGKDVVYSLDNNNTLTQCLCTTNGKGIQTNWWKFSNLTQDEINVLGHQGWMFIPDGSAWGLDGAGYLAKNSDYQCVGQSQQTGSVLSLAYTGNMPFIVGVLAAGFMLLLAGLFASLKKRFK